MNENRKIDLRIASALDRVANWLVAAHSPAYPIETVDVVSALAEVARELRKECEEEGP